jgi:hypothetical protein
MWWCMSISPSTRRQKRLPEHLAVRFCRNSNQQ